MPDRDQPVVELRNVGKRFTKYEDAPTLLGHAMRLGTGRKRSKLWAVRHVDLEVEAGETVGVIGRNGSGKSTMLSVLAGITAPTEGEAIVRGRVAPLIAVGVGFHPELTGRENVYVNGTVLGLSRPEIDRRFDAIVDFAEIDEFIDTPVKFYSSGMFVRLGFSVAIAASPDVLLVDEVLAVGDLAFQMKCFRRMAEIQSEGATILVVSHNLSAVRNLCSRVLVLHRGDPVFLGPTEEALSCFHRILATGTANDSAAPALDATQFVLLDQQGEETGHVEAGSPVAFRVAVIANERVEHPMVGFRITSESGATVYSESAPIEGCLELEPGAEVTCEIRMEPHLATGSYTAQMFLRPWAPDGDDAPSMATTPLLFYVSGRSLVKGVVDLHASFGAVHTRSQPPS